MSRLEKMTKIAEWESKGAEWCARELWKARENCKEAVRRDRKRAFESKSESWKCSELKDANERLMKLLKKEGVKPKELTITYDDSSCEFSNWCEDYHCDFCDKMNYYDTTEKFRFYDVKISNGYVEGITKDLKDVGLVAKRIIDEDSHTVLYERKEQDD